jgi:tetratricopeptide (TPR) repeat protein
MTSPGLGLLPAACLIIGLIAPVCFATGGATPYAGTDGVPLVQIEVNGRVNGLAGAFTAAADDASGLSANPAGLVHLSKKQVTFTHFDWLGDTSIQNLLYAQPLKEGTIAGSVTYLNVPRMVNYDRFGYENGTVGLSSMAFSAAYGLRVRAVSLGVQLKVAYLSMEGYSAATFAADLGSQFFVKNIRIPVAKRGSLALKPLKIGVCLQNIATRAGQDAVPLRVKAGLQYPLLDSLSLAFDLSKTLYRIDSFLDGDYRAAIGVDYNYKELIYARIGFRLGNDLNFFTAGFGVRYRFGPVDTYVDYVYLPQKTLGNVNNFSVTTKFEDLKAPIYIDRNRQRLMEMYYYKGLTYYVQEEFDKAIAEWKKALELDPKNAVILKKIREAEEMKVKMGK